MLLLPVRTKEETYRLAHWDPHHLVSYQQTYVEHLLFESQFSVLKFT